MNELHQQILLGMCIVLTLICIYWGCLLCCFAFTMQNGFQDICQFAVCNLKLEQKLKILDFMKRFGKVSLCLWIGGFFVINKKIPFKMAKTLQSVFSGLLKLRNVSNLKKECDNFVTNYTSYN
ncbi:uncharacterized protein LOC111635744 [Centruroides sculpturatus]|uniref:uncharacterized protein LOC111635744 n=1 Tax=Centruroides sculpturatus TaxID=218467 RepID=UPI000C6D4F3C|nr:uncharacterized protein LOC111635744 [Centruroides sculpturatus]